MRTITLLLALSMSLPALAGRKVSLAYTSNPGVVSSLQLRTKVEGTSTITLGGEVLDMPVAFEMAVDYGIVGVPATRLGWVAQDATVLRVAVRASRPGLPDQVIVADASGVTADGQPQEAELVPPNVFAGSLGTVRFKASGTDMEAGIVQDLPGPFGEIVQMFGMLHPVLPATKVKPGQSWTGTRELPISLEVEAPILPTLTYTLTDVTDGIANIRLQGRYDGIAGSPAALPGGVPMKLETLSYVVTGEASIDVQRGVLLRADMDVKVQIRAGTDEGDFRMVADLPVTYTLGPVP